MKLLVFAGTVEARLLCERLSAMNIKAMVCTATTYGADCLKHLHGLTVYGARQNYNEMAAFIKQNAFSLVVDATHPYACEATENIRMACDDTNVRYIRLLRETGTYDNITTVADIKVAVNYLAKTFGNILVTTGSKELGCYCELPDYRTRLFVRVLPVPEVIAYCHELGFDAKHIIAMQGPFLYELNLALFRQFNCSWLVTKNTGKAGGLDAKILAARAAGTDIVLIDRPIQEEGLSLDEVLQTIVCLS